MQVREASCIQTACCEEGALVDLAVGLMPQASVVAVQNDNDTVTGLLTVTGLERWRQSICASALRARDVMSRGDFITCDASDELERALDRMRSQHASYAVVMDGKQYVGILHLHHGA